MNYAEKKLNAIEKVLNIRYDILVQKVLTQEMTAEQEQWYRGRVAGIMDALELLSDPLESICVELETPKK